MRSIAYVIAGAVVVIYLIFMWRNFQSTKSRRSRRRLDVSGKNRSRLDSKSDEVGQDRPKVDLHKDRRLGRSKSRF